MRWLLKRRSIAHRYREAMIRVELGRSIVSAAVECKCFMDNDEYPRGVTLNLLQHSAFKD
jgi:hypothetical protein